MKNKHLWKPSKFVMTNRGLSASSDLNEVGIGSRFVASIQAKAYEELINLHSFGFLLDLGCGKVPLYEVYRKHVSDNTCIDWLNSSHDVKHGDYYFDLNKELPLSSESFDTILITDVLEHILCADLLWSEMKRLLKPGGKIILGVPFLYCVHESPYDYNRYTEYKLKYYCIKNNLEIVYLEPYGGAPEVILDIIAKNLIFSKVLSNIHLFVSKLFIKSPLGKRISNSTLRKFPLGYCLVARK